MPPSYIRSTISFSFVQALEIGHFRGVAGFDQRLEPGLDQVGDAAAQHGLLAEQVGFAFLAEVGFDDARAAAADARGIGEGDVMGVAGGVLMRPRSGRARRRRVEYSLRTVWPGPLGAIMITSMSARGSIRPKWMLRPWAKASAAPGLQVAREVVGIDRGLMLVGGEDHEDVGPCGGFGVGHAP